MIFSNLVFTFFLARAVLSGAAFCVSLKFRLTNSYSYIIINVTFKFTRLFRARFKRRKQNEQDSEELIKQFIHLVRLESGFLKLCPLCVFYFAKYSLISLLKLIKMNSVAETLFLLLFYFAALAQLEEACGLSPHKYEFESLMLHLSFNGRWHSGDCAGL